MGKFRRSVHMTDERKTTYSSTYKTLAVQWLNVPLCFVSSSVVADSFRLRNRQLLVAAKRWGKSPFGTIFPNDRSATPTAGKPSWLRHDILPTVAFDGFRRGVKNSFRNDVKAKRSLPANLKNRAKQETKQN